MADPSIQSEPNTPTTSSAIQSEAPVSPPPILPSGKSPRAALMIVFLVVFIDLLGFGIVLPLLPIYGDKYVAQASSRKAVRTAPSAARLSGS